MALKDSAAAMQNIRLTAADLNHAAKDLREAMAVVGPGEGDWALVLGGAFPKAGVASALERVLADEGLGVRRLGTDRFESSHGISFGRAVASTTGGVCQMPCGLLWGRRKSGGR